MNSGGAKLFLIPTSLTEETPGSLSPEALNALLVLDNFIVERARSARRFIKACHPSRNIQELNIEELDKHNPVLGIREMLQPAIDGQDMGLLSEAGCPGVADPGALVVEQAHALGIRVVPLVGPSSILLALMASGMNGQSFCFNGYLPAKKPNLEKVLQKLEQRSRKLSQTEIWIETPYRNKQMLETVFDSLSASTRFCVAVNLTGENERIISRRIKDWTSIDLEFYQKNPAVFLIET